MSPKQRSLVKGGMENKAASQDPGYPGVPYATSQSNPAEVYPREFHLRQANVDVQDKVGLTGFNPEDYRDSIMEKERVHECVRAKKYGLEVTAPYATSTFDDRFPEDYQGRIASAFKQKKEMGVKVGKEVFGSEVYATALLANKMTQELSKTKNYKTGEGPYATLSDVGDPCQLVGCESRKEKVAGKIGAEGFFDSNVYSSNLASVRNHQTTSKMKAFHGSGDIIK